MGTFLAAGIPAYISICGEKGKLDKSKLQKFYHKLNEFVCLDLYEHIENNQYDVFRLKDISKDDIYKTLNEFMKITKIDPSFYYLEEPSDFETLLSDNCNFKIVYDYKMFTSKYMGVLINDEFYDFDFSFFDPTWLYKSFYIATKIDDIEVEIGYLPIWRNVNKIIIEDETKLLFLLNTFKTKNFTRCSDLTKSILFYIAG